jgi:hypothetical protein
MSCVAGLLSPGEGVNTGGGEVRHHLPLQTLNSRVREQLWQRHHRSILQTSLSFGRIDLHSKVR